MNLKVTHDEKIAEEYEKDLRRVYIQSNLPFLQVHNGLRPGKLHLVLGPTHTGKTTLVRSLLHDIMNNNIKMKVLVWLSEETKADFEQQFFKTPKMGKNFDHLLVGQEPGDLMATLKTHPDINVLIYDNITTSRHYSGTNFNDQERFVRDLKNYFQKTGIAGIVVAHTGSQIKTNQKKLIEIEDIRGGRSIANLSEFAYILQRWIVDTRMTANCLRIAKHRGYALTDVVYKFGLDRENLIYSRFVSVDYLELKNILKTVFNF